jgi:hypothetical protein
LIGEANKWTSEAKGFTPLPSDTRRAVGDPLSGSRFFEMDYVRNEATITRCEGIKMVAVAAKVGSIGEGNIRTRLNTGAQRELPCVRPLGRSHVPRIR